MHGGGIQDFDTRWDQVLVSKKKSEVPNGKILVSLYKMRRRGCDQLRTVLAMYEQAINQDRSNPSYQKLKTMVKKRIDQKIRTRNFQARNERIETGVLVKTQQGKNVSAEGNQENAISRKQEDSGQKEMLAASATTSLSVERKHNRPLLLQGRRHKMTEENFRKGSLPQAVVFLEGAIKKRAHITSMETCRIRHVTIGILPFVQATNLNQDANTAKNVS